MWLDREIGLLPGAAEAKLGLPGCWAGPAINPSTWFPTWGDMPAPKLGRSYKAAFVSELKT